MIVRISPKGSMDQLSQLEVQRLKQSSQSDLYQLYRNCSLAVLASGMHTDNASVLFDKYRDFQVNVLTRERGLQLELINPPEQAFVDGEIILGLQEHLFSVLRDLLYVSNKYDSLNHINLSNSSHITDVVVVFF